MFTSEQREKHISVTSHSQNICLPSPKGAVFRIAQINNFKLRIEISTTAAANDLVQCIDDIFVPYRVYIAAERVEVEGVVHLSVDDLKSNILRFGIRQFGEAKVLQIPEDST